MKKIITSWGNTTQHMSNYYQLNTITELQNILQKKPIIARGNGRSYGDSAIGDNIISMLNFNSISYFDENNGIITCDSGVMFADLIPIILNKGWFVHVTPGTKWVTVGGAIASDIHGKNHQKVGCFSECIVTMDILQQDGTILSCSKDHLSEIFHATCGGMGLTGIILRATLQLMPVLGSYIKQTVRKTKSLEELMALFENDNSMYSVAWLDCVSRRRFGRGLLATGEHCQNDIAHKDQRSITIPASNLSYLLNPYSIRIFNILYYYKQSIKTQKVPYQQFFYPLDSISNWNKLYGSKGFMQYQFVLPDVSSYQGLTKILKTIYDDDQVPYLAVLKKLGKANNNLMSFPVQGYSLALDFKMKASLIPFLHKLDHLVCNYGGRVYLTKDACISEELCTRMYPRITEFREFRERMRLNKKFNSLQSQRLKI